MTDTRLVLVTVSVLVRAPVEFDALQQALDHVSDSLQQAVQGVVSSDRTLETTGVTSFHYPGDEDENARRCSLCGRWATDIKQPQWLDGLSNGYEVAGVFRCDQCHEQCQERNGPDAA